MSKVRVWNITDDARTDVVPHTRMVLGKVIKPGRSVLVDASRLEGATKVQKEVAAGFLFIGEQLPVEYVKQKRPPRALADARVIDASGRPVGEKVKIHRGHGEVLKTENPAEKLPPPPVDEEKVEVSLADAAKVEDHLETREESGRGKRHRR